MRFPVNRHRLWQVAVDGALIALAWVLSWYVRFDARPRYYDRYLEWDVVVGVVAIMLPVFVAFGFYNRWWRYVSTQDMWGVLRGVVTAVVAAFLVFTLLDFHRASVPRGIWIIDLLLLLAFVMGVRLLARTLIERPSARSIMARGKEVLIVGAGDAAQLMLREMLRNPSLGYTPIGLVDDDPRKKNVRLHGVRVVGTTAELSALLRERRPDELLIAIPSASGDVRERIVEVARVENVTVKTLPALHELITGDFSLAGQIRPVEVEDLLGREPVETDLESIAGYLANEVVLVTGAGGSIGSELCRQIARMGPTRLVLVDNSEPGLFEIERELVDEREFHATAAVLADAGNATKMRQVFEKYRPAVVFHAAAYKHVALVEANPIEAVRNNTLVTRTVADVAVEFGAKRFVLISTDKAVHAKNVMGSTKALCEWVVESWGHRDDTTTRFCGVRFGNVLGSSGSVIPIFRKQIARGGPVTVTHPDMTRFFMTIPEAVQLVIQAGAIGGRGQVYVLDMGEPVKITDLAETMIRLSGKEPGRDIAIEFVGARPGEKLHEVLWSETETVSPSTHAGIMLVTRPPIDPVWLEDELDELARLVVAGETLELIGHLSTIAAAPRRNGVLAGDGAGAAVATPASETILGPALPGGS
jgi:FlaA1/EpsC-like NDP-sugar epimerase